MAVDYLNEGRRANMVREIKSKGIEDSRILEVMQKFPRHALLADSGLDAIAYQNCPVTIGYSQTMSQPYTVAKILEFLDIRKGEKVLDIGTGSGYQACLMGMLGATVHSVEIIKDLYLEYKGLIKYWAAQFEISLTLYLEDGNFGIPKEAPFDKIAIAAQAEEVPSILVEQLREGGILVMPIGKPQKQVLSKLQKQNGRMQVIAEEKYFRFVQMTTYS